MEHANRTVLLIEDNADDERLVVRSFQKAGLESCLVIARDGAEAIEKLTCGPQPVLILLDLKLPRIGGVEVLKWIRSCPSVALTPVVALTSSDEPADIRDCYLGGANAFVRKPVGFEEYMDDFQVLLRFWLEINMVLPPEAAASSLALR